MDAQKLSRRAVLLGTVGVISTQTASGQAEEGNTSQSESDPADNASEEADSGGEDRHPPGLRAINLAPDVPSIDVTVNGETFVEGLTHLDPHTETIELPQDLQEETALSVSAEPTNGSFPDVVAPGAEGEIQIGQELPRFGWTVFFAGEQCEVTDRRFRPVVIEDDHSPTPPGMSRVTAHHFAPDVPRGDVLLPDGTPLFEDIGFGEWKTKTIPAVDSEVTIVSSHDGEEIESFNIMPKEGAVHSASLVGYRNPDNIPTLAEENPPPGKDDWTLGLAISEDAIVGVEGGQEDEEEEQAQGNETNQTTQQ